MFPFGNGFNTINHKEYHIIEANFLTLSLMKRKLKLAITTFGFGLQSSQTVSILGNYISSERNMLIAERKISKFINKQIRKT